MKLGILLPWLVILAIAIGLPFLTAKGDRPSAAIPSTAPASRPIDLQFTMLGKYAVATRQLAKGANAGPLLQQLDTAAKTPDQQVAAAIVAGELVGKDEALLRLEKLDTAPADSFRALYRDGSQLPAQTRQHFGFFAALAQSAGQPDDAPERAAVLSVAKRVAIILFSVFGLLLLAGLAGLALLITGIFLFALGKLTFQTAAPTPPPSNHATYIQAFALYLVLFFGSSFLLALVGDDLPLILKVLPTLIPIGLAACYPLLRGVPLQTLRHDWGIHAGKSPFLEPLFGIFGYIACLPLIAIGLVITLVLSRLAGVTPAHPIVNEVADHFPTIFFLAVVFAPITEELLFRGAFLSHCRAWLGPFTASLLTGLVFAAIHPQGWAAIPLLGSIGASLALIRQWRGTLIPSMTAHALNNATAITLVYLIS